MTSDDRVAEMRSAVQKFENGEISEEEVREYSDVPGFGRLLPMARTRRNNPVDLEKEANEITACITADATEE
jgi:hypothetical protein